MAFRVKLSDGSVQSGLRRIAGEQIARAIDEVDDDTLDTDQTVHQVRKRCKKLRGLVRLVRPAFDGYDDENKAFRDAARALSGLRDSTTIVATYDGVAEHFADQIDRAAFASIRRRLTLQGKILRSDEKAADLLAAFRDQMVKAGKRVPEWQIGDDGFDAVAGGLAKTYGRARKAMSAAAEKPTAERLHDWRKRVKYHWYHARLLEGIRPAMIAPHIAAANRLGDLLGDHHDLAVLRERIDDEPDAFGGRRDVDAFIGLIGRRQDEMETEAFRLGRVLLAEKPKALVGRFATYWQVWRERAATGPLPCWRLRACLPKISG